MKPSVGRKASISYILFVLLMFHIVLLSSLTACGKKAPPVPPKEKEALSAIRLEIADIIFRPFHND